MIFVPDFDVKSDLKTKLSKTQLVLASSSPYRRRLLAQLRLQFEVVSPDIDETCLPGESADTLAMRLAESKARAIVYQFPASLIIGCDQTASLNGELIGKPSSHQDAVTQLRRVRGEMVVFYSAICLLNSESHQAKTRVVETSVLFAYPSDFQIERYLVAEQPYDCTGSAKIDGLGIALVKEIKGSDPSALIGLPLIALVEMLNEHGIDVL